MVRTVRWAFEAKRERLAWLIRIAGRDEELAKRAFADTITRTDELAPHPFAYRPARWPGLRELSLTHWKKIIVYQVTDAEVIIVAFYDARQDLSRVHPIPESA